jgi:alpha-methylacyl-CoA racemase
MPHAEPAGSAGPHPEPAGSAGPHPEPAGSAGPHPERAGSAGPLAGLRVVELAGIGPAPLACQLLADLGAEVLRVVRPGAPAIGIDGLGGGRPVLRADLTDPRQRATVRAAAARADVLVEGFRPGTAERLGVGPAECRAENERLVYVRMTGWGQEGPLAGTAGHDINYLAATGALHAIGTAETPVPPLNLLADYGGGAMLCVVGVLAALHARTRTGSGQVVDAAMVDGVSYLMSGLWAMLGAGSWTDRRAANLLDGGAPFYDVYACRDDRYLAVGPLEPQFFAELTRLVGLPGSPPQYDRAGWAVLRERLRTVFRTKSREEWAAVFSGSDACVTPVASLSEAPDGEHLAARATLPRVGGRVRPAPAPRFSGTPAPGPTEDRLRPDEDGARGRALLAAWGLAE